MDLELLRRLEAELECLSDCDDEDDDMFLMDVFSKRETQPDKEKDDEWADFLESSVNINERFKAMETNVFLDSFGSRIAISTQGDVERGIMGICKVSHVDVLVEPEVVELLAEMVAAVELSAPLFVPHVDEVPVVVDLSSLPCELLDEKEFVSEVVDVQYPQSWMFEEETSQEVVSHSDMRTWEERTRQEEDLELLQTLEKDRLKRLERKHKRESEMQFAKQRKAVIKLQSKMRIYIARSVVKLRRAQKLKEAQEMVIIATALNAIMVHVVDNEFQENVTKHAAEIAEEEREAIRMIKWAELEREHSERLLMHETDRESTSLRIFLIMELRARIESELASMATEDAMSAILRTRRRDEEHQAEVAIAAAAVVRAHSGDNWDDPSNGSEAAHDRGRRGTRAVDLDDDDGGNTKGVIVGVSDPCGSSVNKIKQQYADGLREKHTPQKIAGSSGGPAGAKVKGWGGAVCLAPSTSSVHEEKRSDDDHGADVCGESRVNDKCGHASGGTVQESSGKNGGSVILQPGHHDDESDDGDDGDDGDDDDDDDELTQSADSWLSMDGNESKEVEVEAEEQRKQQQCLRIWGSSAPSCAEAEVVDLEQLYPEEGEDFEAVAAALNRKRRDRAALAQSRSPSSQSIAVDIVGANTAENLAMGIQLVDDNGVVAWSTNIPPSPIIAALDAWVRWTEDISVSKRDDAGKDLERGKKDAAVRTGGVGAMASSVGANHVVQNVPVNGADISTLTTSELASLKRLGLRPPNDAAPIFSLELCVEALQSCSFLRCFTTLRSLELNVNKLTDIDGLAYMTNLEHLSLKDNSLRSIQGIAPMLRLKSLKLDNNQLSEAAMMPISGLEQLTLLTANTNNLKSVPPLKCPNLQRLELYHNHISHVAKNSLRILPSLTHLDLGRNKLESIDGEGLSQCSLLHTLVLSQNKLSSLPFPLYLPNLKQMWLSGNQLTSMHEWAPSMSPRWDQSCSAWVSCLRSQATDSECDVKSPTKNWPIFLPLLEKVFLQDNAIKRIDAGAFSAIPLLAELDLSFNSIASVRDLLGLAAGVTPCLRTLQLQDNPIYAQIGTRPSQRQQREMRPSAYEAASYSLRDWLKVACPGLQYLSGSLQHEVLGEDEDSGARRRFLGAEKTPSKMILTGASQMIANFRSKGKWQATPLLTKNEVGILDGLSAAPPGDWGDSDAAEMEHLSRQKCAAACKLLLAESVDVTSSTGDVGLSSDFSWIFHQMNQLQNTSPEAVSLIQFLCALSTDQSSLRAKEKAERCSVATSLQPSPAAKGSNSKREIAEIDGKMEERYWETAVVNLLASHAEALTRWRSHGRRNVLPKEHVRAFNGVAIGTLVVVRYSTATAVGECESASSQEGTTGAEIDEAAAKKLQKVFRGCRTRRQLRAALESARYLDDELDQLMEGDLDLHASMDMDYLLKPAELQPDWLCRSKVGLNNVAEEGVEEMELESYAHGSLSLGASMVYGDHKRGRRTVPLDRDDKELRSSSDTIAQSQDIIEQCPGFGQNSAHSRFDSWMKDVLNPKKPSSPRPSSSAGDGVFSSRPASSTSDASIISIASNGNGHISRSAGRVTSRGGPRTSRSTLRDVSPTASPSRHVDSSRSCPSPSMPSPPSSMPSARSKAAVAEDWGISDPKLLAAVMKRNRRMKYFADAKEVREKEKDPEVRYQKFVKAAGVTGSAATKSGRSSQITSGSFGGKPKSGHGAGGGGSGQRRAVVPPAWMLGTDLGES